MSLATKWRPTEFADVCSQQSIVKILSRQLEQNQLKNVYLFCGPSGCGKTSMARIFANKINKGMGTPIEIDAASNSGVDNVRQIISEATERSLDSEYKIYVIDECHGLSNTAWQAFLKCIEEPPKYTIFIFCTTDPQKIPATIVNRCMRFNFTRITSDVIKSRLDYICEQEGFTNYGDTTDYISKICRGQMRDAVSYLEKVSSGGNNFDIKSTMDILGNYDYVTYFTLTNALIDNRVDIVLDTINNIYLSGTDLKLFVEQYLVFILDIMKFNIFKTFNIIKIPMSLENDIKNLLNFENAGKYYQYVLNSLLDLKNQIKTDADVKSTVEVILLKIASCM